MAEISGILHEIVRTQPYQEAIKCCLEGQVVMLFRAIDDAHDENAISVWAGFEQIGFIGQDVAVRLAPLLDAGHNCHSVINTLTREGGVIIEIRDVPPEATATAIAHDSGPVS